MRGRSAFEGRRQTSPKRTSIISAAAVGRMSSEYCTHCTLTHECLASLIEISLSRRRRLWFQFLANADANAGFTCHHRVINVYSFSVRHRRPLTHTAICCLAYVMRRTARRMLTFVYFIKNPPPSPAIVKCVVQTSFTSACRSVGGVWVHSKPTRSAIKHQEEYGICV